MKSISILQEKSLVYAVTRLGIEENMNQAPITTNEEGLVIDSDDSECLEARSLELAHSLTAF